MLCVVGKKIPKEISPMQTQADQICANSDTNISEAINVAEHRGCPTSVCRLTDHKHDNRWDERVLE